MPRPNKLILIITLFVLCNCADIYSTWLAHLAMPNALELNPFMRYIINGYGLESFMAAKFLIGLSIAYAIFKTKAFRVGVLGCILLMAVFISNMFMVCAVI